MGSIPPEKIQEVRDRVDIERVIGRTVQLKRVGSRLVGLCPFHSEKTPSFGVDTQKKLYHCFGCNAGGDAFAFVQRIEGVEFPEAVRILAREFGIDLPEREESLEEKRARSERERLFDINDMARGFYERVLWKEPRALTYLREERGLSDDTIRAWRLGFALDQWSALSDFLIGKGIAPETLVKLGLAGRRREGNGFYDKLRGRIVFPIAIPGGSIAGFGARRADWLTQEGEDRGPKYLNSQESPIYEKSTIFFGLAEARDSVRRAKRAVLVEGYLDVIALHQAGVTTAIATCGTAISGKHAAQLSRLAPEVITLYDGDPAGVQATSRAAEILLATGVSVRVVSLPDGEDPDTYVRRFGASELETQIQNAPSAIDHAVDAAAKRSAGAGLAGLVRIVEEIRPLLVSVKDPRQRDLFVQSAAGRLRLRPGVLEKQLGLGAPVRINEVDVVGVQKKAQGSDDDKLSFSTEAALLRMLVEEPERVAKAVEAKDALSAFCHPAVRAAMAAGVAAVKLRGPFDAQRALEAAQNAGASEKAMMFLRKTLLDALPIRYDVDESLKNLLRTEYERRLRDLKRRTALEQDSEALERLNVEIAAVVRAKASLR